MNISEVTRLNVIDHIRAKCVKWWGRLEEIEFLSRLYDLKKMPSTDHRCDNAEEDIHMHRVNFADDWEDDWIFADERFNLLRGTDENFLRFLCETLHPMVRPKPREVNVLLKVFNKHLAVDGWELYANHHISRRRVFAARPLAVKTNLRAARSVALVVDTDYIHRQINRMDSAVENDPELAIGTAKEFVESVCKTVLGERRATSTGREDFPQLVRATLKELKLAPDDVRNSGKASETLRVLLQNLAAISSGLVELRNPYGTGHGREAQAKGLRTRHARLAVGAASALAVFLFETHKETQP